jgi:hypothetical protein
MSNENDKPEIPFGVRLKAAIELFKRDYADNPDEDVNVGLAVGKRALMLAEDKELCNELVRDYDRIEALETAVKNLPVDEQYRTALLASIQKYRKEILARPEYKPGEGWDDLEALQQVTLEDGMAAYLRKLNEEGR